MLERASKKSFLIQWITSRLSTLSRPNLGDIMMHDVIIEEMIKLKTMILALSLFSWSS